MQAFGGYAGFFGGVLQRIGFYKLGKIVEGNIRPCIGFIRSRRVNLPLIFRTQAVADIVLTANKTCVFIDEFLIDLAVLNNVIGDVIENNQIAVGFKNNRNVCEFKCAGFVGRHGHNLHVLERQSPVGNARP